MKYENSTHKFVSIIGFLHRMAPRILNEVLCKLFYHHRLNMDPRL
jgi:hypothetical protein